MKARVCGRCGTIVVGGCKCKTAKQNSHSKGYGTRWRRFRERLYRHRVRSGSGVLCAICGLAFGSTSPHADHIIPVQSNDDPLFYDPGNIQFLHPNCHAEKTVRDVKAGTTR